jgi:hypothetical protein
LEYQLVYELDVYLVDVWEQQLDVLLVFLLVDVLVDVLELQLDVQ